MSIEEPKMTDIGTENEISVPLEEDAPIEVMIEGENQPEGQVDDRELALQQMKSQLEEVSRRHEQEKIARHRAEQFAFEQARAAQDTQNDLHQSNYQVVVSGIENMKQTIEQAKRAFAEATAAGDYAGAAEANDTIAWANAHLKDLFEGKSRIESHLQPTEGRVADNQAPQQYAPQQEQPQQLSPEQQFNALLSRLTPKSAAWMREHPQAAADMNKLSAAHNAATILKGIPVESPEYFSFIENELGMGGNRSSGRKPAMASAPVSSAGYSSGRSSSYNGGSTMTLSAAEVEQALLIDPDLPREKAIEQYARNKAALIREGKMSA
jgi:hypothetical protein